MFCHHAGNQLRLAIALHDSIILLIILYIHSDFWPPCLHPSRSARGIAADRPGVHAASRGPAARRRRTVMCALAFIVVTSLLMAQQCAAVGATAAAPRLAGSRPHIVFLLTDDLGYNAPGYRNSDLHTPALDALAAGGLKIEEYYTYQFCSPSRGAFHTGRMPFRHLAVQHNLIPWSVPAGIDLRYDFLPLLLRRVN